MKKHQFVEQMIVFALAWIALPFLLACDKGCTEYEGNCACDAIPEKAVQTYVPSDEKPPRSGRPSYEAQGIHPDLSPSKETATTPDDASGKIPNGGVPPR